MADFIFIFISFHVTFLITDWEKYSTVINNSQCSFNFFLNIHTSRENGLHMLNYLKALEKPAKFHSGSRKKTALVVKYVRMVF